MVTLSNDRFLQANAVHLKATKGLEGGGVLFGPKTASIKKNFQVKLNLCRKGLQPYYNICQFFIQSDTTHVLLKWC